MPPLPKGEAGRGLLQFFQRRHDPLILLLHGREEGICAVQRAAAECFGQGACGEYLGDSVEGKTVFVADDIIASGESMLEVATNLKERGAKRIIANATFPLFTSGLEKFDKAVADGILDYVTGTNLTYRMPELLTRDWYVDVDVSKYAAYFVVALNHDMSVSSIIDPIKKIEALLASRK